MHRRASFLRVNIPRNFLARATNFQQRRKERKKKKRKRQKRKLAHGFFPRNFFVRRFSNVASSSCCLSYIMHESRPFGCNLNPRNFEILPDCFLVSFPPPEELEENWRIDSLNNSSLWGQLISKHLETPVALFPSLERNRKVERQLERFL